MNEFEFREFDEAYEEARIALKKAVSNPELHAYADDYGPLMLGQIAGSRLQDERLQQVMAQDDWPSLREDSLIEPLPEYADDNAFIDSMCPRDEYGERHLISSSLFMLLRQRPRHEGDLLESAYSLLGAYPVVHRAHAVAPELFGSLGTVLDTLINRYGGLITDEDHLREEIERPHNEAVVKAMHMAYRIMGRLIKVDDGVRIGRRLGFASRTSQTPTTILNADEFLRHGL